MTTTRDGPLVAVVVIGRNEGERLRRCLESVRAMRSPDGDVEMIYVDSDSTDNSVEVAGALGARVIRVRSERPTAALGRNAGWRACSGKYVLFLDGDTVLHRDFVVSSLPEFAASQVAVVWGHRREMNTQASIYNRVLDLDWIYAPGRTEFCGGDALIRRSVLDEVGGYDENLIAGEEPEMCRRMRARGWQILHVDRPMTGHDLSIHRWSQYWRRAVRAGYAYAEVSTRFQDTESPFWREEARRNFQRGSFLILLFVVGLLTSALWRSALPLAAAGLFFLSLAARTARKVAWKSPERVTRLLYGIHSHLQQIPVLIGQLKYHIDRRARYSRRLIEYK